MRKVSAHCCEEMSHAIREGEIAIRYVDKFREYGIAILDGGTAHQVIQYCPWCGAKLPLSLRDEWFARLQDLGLEPGDAAIPKSMKNSEWWKKKTPE